MEFLEKIKKILKRCKDELCKIWKKCEKTTIDGITWMGYDGLLNMETSALLTIFFMLFFPLFVSMSFSAFIVIGKCLMDKINGHMDEMHDFLCCAIGLALGAILSLVHAAIILN